MIRIHLLSLLAAYDLGASAKLLQAINDDSTDGVNTQRPINLDEPEAPGTITEMNWTEHLEQEKCASIVCSELSDTNALFKC